MTPKHDHSWKIDTCAGTSMSIPPLFTPAIALWLGTGSWARDAAGQLSSACLLVMIISTGLLSTLPGPRAILLRLLLPLMMGLLLAPPETASPAELVAGPVLIEGKVASVPRRHIGRKTRPLFQGTTILKLQQLKRKNGPEDEPIDGIVTISLPGVVMVGRGDRIQTLLTAGNGSFRKVARSGHWRVISRGTLLSQADRLRLRALDCLLSIDARWGCALLLGERGLLDPETRAVMKRTGLSHLLAVSGLHVGICLGFFLICSRRFLSPMSHVVRGLGAV
ncbi:MAG: ComEC/Rec2 family competence protein, partial [Planctomycetota bacterium]